jgi:hypothetical protein
MEHNFYNEDFERLLREKTDEFRLYPTSRMWHSIYNNLHPSKKWPSITVTLILVSMLFLMGYWNSSRKIDVTSNAKYSPSNTSSNAIVVQKLSNNDNPVTLPSQINTVANTAALSNNVSSQLINSISYNTTKKAQTNVTHTSNTQSLAATATKQSGDISNITTDANKVVEKNTAQSLLTNMVQFGVTVNQTATANNNANSLLTEVLPTQITAHQSSEIAANYNNTNIAAADNGNITTAPTTKKVITSTANSTSFSDKVFMDHDALYNKRQYKKWKGRLASEVYITPGVGLRSFYSNAKTAVPTSFAIANSTQVAANVAYNAGFTLQAGAGFQYAVTKNMRLKVGTQLAFTSYGIPAIDINHTVATTLTFNDGTRGNPYLVSRSSSLANVPGHNNKKIRNQTTQISLPIGAAVKILGNEKMEWYAGGTIQPTVVIGGKAHLLSTDHNNYVTDASMLRKFNMNGAAETYIQYKLPNFTFQAGPELRYQFGSTYSKKYANTENLYNVGVKLGIVKNL